MGYRVSEIFYSLSGEGISQGIPTIFVRFSGCSLRCGKGTGRKLWCDTEYALSPNSGVEIGIPEIASRVASLCKTPGQVIFTGGEPLEEGNRDACIQLMVELKQHFLSDTPIFRFETNGKEDIREVAEAVFSLDYKLPGSGMEEYMLEENFIYLRDRKNSMDEIKFVVRDENDFHKAMYMVSKWNLRNICLSFSPVQNELELAILAEWLKEAKLPNSRLSFQLHKFLWGNKRGV